MSIAVVTGASRGIGLACASTLAQAGYHVIGTATSKTGAEAITQQLSPWSGEGRVLKLESHDDLEHFVADIVESHRTIDVLVNNAGITRDALSLKMSHDQWNQVLDTNLTGTFFLCQAAIKRMVKQRNGKIINIASVVASLGNPGQANYSATKAGLVAMSKSLALEVAKRGITVNVISPGFIQSDMTDSLSENVVQELMKKIPMNRMGTCQDVANAVGFLASSSADYMTGTTLHINGGMYMS
jgi:3-oxoacyl-[acyl-carrier protein] reductase